MSQNPLKSVLAEVAFDHLTIGRDKLVKACNAHPQEFEDLADLADIDEAMRMLAARMDRVRYRIVMREPSDSPKEQKE